MYHIPSNGFSRGIPGVFPDGLVVLKGYVLLYCRNFPVKRAGGYGNGFVVFKSLCGFFHYGKGFGKYFGKGRFFNFVAVVLQFVYLVVVVFFFVDVFLAFRLFFKGINLVLHLFLGVFYFLSEEIGLCPQFIVGEFFNGCFVFLYLVNKWLYLANVLF